MKPSPSPSSNAEQQSTANSTLSDSVSHQSADLHYWTYRGCEWTFLNTKARYVAEKYLTGRVLNTCAGVVTLNHDGETVRNDIQESVTLNIGGDRTITINGSEYNDGETISTQTDSNVPISELENNYETESFDAIIHDPPWSSNQATETYEVSDSDRYTNNVKKNLHSLLRPGGYFIQAAFTPQLMPPKLQNQYEIEHISLFNTFGRKRDFYIVVGKKRKNNTTYDSTDGTTHTYRCYSDTVLPNRGVLNIPYETGSTLGGNGGNEIDITILQQTSPNPEITINELSKLLVESHLSGDALDISTHDTAIPLTHNDYIAHIHPNSGNTALPDDPHPDHNGRTVKHFSEPIYDTYIMDERILADKWDTGGFDTIIINLPQSASSNHVAFNGEDRGRLAATFENSNLLLKPDGNMIHISDTATCCPGRMPYIRSAVTCLPDPSDYSQSQIITCDQKQPNADVEPSVSDTPADIDTWHNPLDSSNCSEPTPRYYCIHCGEGTYFHPAYTVNCPTCYATPDEHCVENGVVRPMQSPHQSRVEQFSQHHKGHCTQTTTPPPHRLSTEVQPPDSDTNSQKQLTEYLPR